MGCGTSAMAPAHIWVSVNYSNHLRERKTACHQTQGTWGCLLPCIGDLAPDRYHSTHFTYLSQIKRRV